MTLLLGIALANGPARTAGRTPIGEMRVGTDRVRMVHEELEIRLLSLEEVEVRATYQLHNPDPAAVVRFSVPVTSGGADGAYRDSNAAASVRILSNGTFVPCLIEEGERMATPFEALGGAVTHWCTADLTIPSGPSEIRMSYEGELLFSRPQGPADPLPRGADRKLVYALSPAASWGKKPDEVAITLDLGDHRDRAKVVRPANPEWSGRIASWTLSKPDFSKAAWIEVDLKAADRDQHAIVASFNASQSDWTPTIRVPSGEATALTDADAATAWCGAAGSALQLEWPAPEAAGKAPASCRAALVHIPGDASNAERWAGTGPTSFTLSTCAADGATQPIPIRRAATPDASGQVTPLDAAATEAFFAPWRAEPPPTKPSCMKLEVAGPTEVCLAELGWHVVCP